MSLYLEDEVVKDTLKEIADLSAKGSIITQDFYSKAFVKGETLAGTKKSLKMMEKMGNRGYTALI